MTVAELIALLQTAPGHLDVVVRAEDDNGSDYCGTIGAAGIENSPEAGAFFAIDCGPEDSDDWDGGDGDDIDDAEDAADEGGEQEGGAEEEEEEEEVKS